MEVIINGRRYDDVESLPLSKLQHLRTEASHEVKRVEARLEKDNDKRLERHTLPQLKRLREHVEVLDSLIDETVDW